MNWIHFVLHMNAHSLYNPLRLIKLRTHTNSEQFNRYHLPVYKFRIYIMLTLGIVMFTQCIVDRHIILIICAMYKFVTTNLSAVGRDRYLQLPHGKSTEMHWVNDQSILIYSLTS